MVNPKGFNYIMKVCELFDNPLYTYETSLETQAPGDREWESHISSSGQKLQQQRGAPWSRQKYRARRKINKKQDQQNLEKGGLDEVGPSYQRKSLNGQNCGGRTS